MIDLDALQAAAEAATPGPWDAECDEDEGTTEVNAGSARTQWTDHGDGIRTGRPARSWRSTDRIAERDDMYDEDYEQAEADAAFIAAANPAVVLALLTEHRAALARTARVEALHQKEAARYYGTDLNPSREYDCRGCGEGRAWPCATVRALTEGENDGRE